MVHGRAMRLMTLTAMVGAAACCWGCSKERSVQPFNQPYRLYSIAARSDLPLFYYEVDDTSHRVIDSVANFGSVWQLECARDGRSLFANRRNAVGSPGLFRFDLAQKQVVWEQPISGLFALSGSGDTIVIARPMDSLISVISSATGAILADRKIYLERPETCEKKSLVVGRGAPISAPTIPVIVYDFERDSVLVFAECRGMDGRTYPVSKATIDPEGERVYATCGGLRTIVMDIASWTPLAEFHMRVSYGYPAFGPGGSPVFLPDPGNVDFNWGLIYVVSPRTLTLMDTLTAVGPPCQPLVRYIGKLSLSPDGTRMYGENGGGTPSGSSPILVFDPLTLRVIDWIAMPGTCDRGFLEIAVGKAPN